MPSPPPPPRPARPPRPPGERPPLLPPVLVRAIGAVLLLATVGLGSCQAFLHSFPGL